MASGTRAVAEVLGLVILVFALQVLSPLVGIGAEVFALSLPLAVRPWTIVTSVYAHGSYGHMFANAVALLVVGLFVARRTSRLRFHGFFLAAGAVSGIAAVGLAGVLGYTGTAVLGASGAIFALVGYLLAGNLATERLLGRIELSRRASAAVVALLALGLALATGGGLVVLAGHATGFVIGLVTGRLHLLRAG